MNISVIESPESGWTVISDGHICDGLSVDEVLGQVAHLLITRKPQFRSHNLAEQRYSCDQPAALLSSATL